MLKKLIVLPAAIVALLLMSSPFDSADAKRSGGKHSAGGHARSGGHARVGRAMHSPRMYRSGGKHRFVHKSFRAHKFAHRSNKHRFAHRFHKRRLIVAAPLVYGAYHYADSCYWLKQRALYTGSPYWWDRYNECIYGYGYYSY